MTMNGDGDAEDVYFYRDGRKCEIDLVIQGGRVIHPIEFKSSSNPTREAMFYGWTRPNGSSNYVTKRLTVTGELLSSTNDNSATTYTANYLPSLTTYTINYWLEDANDTGYTKSTAYSQEVQAASGSNWGAKQITGFTYISTTPDGYPSSSGAELDFYYIRGTYNLTFTSYGTVDKTVSSIKFGADVSNDDYTPTCPTALTGYTFDGWYTTSDCLEGTEYNFASATMLEQATDETSGEMLDAQEKALEHMPEGLAGLRMYRNPLKSYNVTGLDFLRRFLKGGADRSMAATEVERPDLRSLDDLVDKLARSGRRVIFTMGKGGVGKTSVAVDIAKGLARRGEKVRLTTTDPADHLGNFDLDIPGLSVSHIDEKHELEAYEAEVLDTARKTMLSAAMPI